MGVRYGSSRRGWWLRAALVGVVLLVWLGARQGWDFWQVPELRDLVESVAEPGAQSGNAEEAWRERRSGVMVELEGLVERVLPDDLDGSRHQRFILQLASGHTLLVAHNVDIANWVPLKTRDLVRLRGQYEWNERGGVVHWTHHDPEGGRPGGWIEHKGERYH